MYRQSEKNLLNNNTTSTCPNNKVNFDLLTAEISWRVWGTPANFNGFRILAVFLLHGTLVAGVSQTAALNRGCHLYSAGWPSRWALAHILVGFRLPWWVLEHNALLINLLISALYTLYVCLASPLTSFFIHLFFLTYLLPYLPFPLRIGRSVSRPEVVRGDWTWAFGF